MSRDKFPVVVHVLLWRASVGGQQEVFLLRRANTGFMDGYYALPGGHQQTGESVSQAANRECREEAGVEADLKAVCVMPYRTGNQQGLNFLFEAHAWRGVPAIGEPALFDDCLWSALDHLPQPHAAWLPNALLARQAGDWFVEFQWD
jgi:8-oxo-dGTP pyrophosphatase MutT (NUDIX family)